MSILFLEFTTFSCFFSELYSYFINDIKRVIEKPITKLKSYYRNNFLYNYQLDGTIINFKGYNVMTVEHIIILYIYYRWCNIDELTLSLWKGSAVLARSSSTTPRCPPAQANERGVWSLLVVCLFTPAFLDIRNWTVHKWPARHAFIRGVRPPSDSCSWNTK